jgi:hypothetical protein
MRLQNETKRIPKSKSSKPFLFFFTYNEKNKNKRQANNCVMWLEMFAFTFGEAILLLVAS